MILSSIFLFSLVCGWLAKCQAKHVSMESMIHRQDFGKLQRAPANDLHEVIIAIQQKNLDLLEQQVLERSTPGSPTYQNWMTFDEVGALITNDEAVTAVTNWLDSHSVKVTWKSPRGEYIKAIAPIVVWENMLATEFHEWEDSYEGQVKTHHLAEHYSIPEEITPHVHAIFNTVQVPPIIRTGRHSNKLQPNVYKTNLRVNMDTQSTSMVTISYLNSYYHIDSNIGNETLTQSVFETANEYFSQDDLAKFQDYFGLTRQAAIDMYGYSTTDDTGSCSVGNDDNAPDCTEGNLDVQYIMGVAQNVATIYWYVGGSNPFLTWVTDMAAQSNPPSVNSLSWGSIEQSNSKSTLVSFNTEAMKLAAMGVTILVSSGDDGAVNFGCDSCSSADSSSCVCNSNSGSSISSWLTSNGDSWTGSGYFPSFPASCPYVTAVGGTMASDGYAPSVGSSEIAAQSNDGGIITSGGGFSTYYARPAWQDDAITAYFDNVASSPPSSGYNPNGRGYPDISFSAVRYQVVISNSMLVLYGTSASAPVFAGFVSLLNSVRLQNGLPSIGFLNPTLYSSNYTSFFNDVTSGSNNCCSYPNEGVCCDSGFSTTTGWDPVTGWGSLHFDKFSQMYNLSTPYAVDTDDSPTSAVSPSIVGVIVVLLVVVIIAAACVWFFWRFCCGSRSQPAAAQHNHPAPNDRL